MVEPTDRPISGSSERIPPSGFRFDRVRVGLIALSSALAALLIVQLVLFPNFLSPGLGVPKTHEPLFLVNGTFYRGDATPVGSPPSTQYRFGNATFALWITNGTGPGGKDLAGNVTEDGTVFSVSISSLSTEPYWFTPDRKVGVLWTGASEVYLLASYH